MSDLNLTKRVETIILVVHDLGAVPNDSTKSTLFKVLVVTSLAKTATECVSDGVEIESNGNTW
jgi:hypothetical protein